MSIAPDAIERIESSGAKAICRSRWLRAVSVEATGDQLAAVRNFSFVKSIEPVLALERVRAEEWESLVGNLETNRPGEAVEPGAYGFSFRQAELARAVEIHQRGGSGRGVLIGMLDTGFQLDHEALAGIDLVAQYDFINHDPDPSFDSRTDIRGQANHGTACLSVIAGCAPARLMGIASNASFALGKTEDTRSETAVEEDYWIEAIEWLEWLGADVVSSSLTYRDWYGADEMDGRAPISRAAQRASDLGMVICISAGNAGPGAITIGAPADAEGVLAVAAVDSSGRLTGFSSRGPASDGRPKPDVAAMGRQVVCVKPMSFDEYARWNGTSLACPIVAGVAALVIEAHPDWPGRKVVEALRMTATRSYMPDSEYGYGLVDAVEAVDYPSVTILTNPGGGFEASFLAQLIGVGGATPYSGKVSVKDGHARFVNLPPGSYSVSIAGENLETSSRPVPIIVPPSGSLFLEIPALP